MVRIPRLWGLMLLLLVGVAGCGGKVPTPVPSPSAVAVAPTDAPPTMPPATATTTASPTATPTLVPSPTATLEVIPNAFGLDLPRGVRVALYADGLENPIVMAQGEQPGVVYVSLNHGVYPRTPTGEILRFVDADGDGVPESRTSFATGLERPLGLLWHEGALYVSHRGAVVRLRDSDGDGVADEQLPIVSDLPAFGLHQNDSLILAPDGRFLLTMGSSTNHGPEPDARNGTILSFNPDGSDLQVLASGFRNPFDMAYDAAGNLFATDNGCDPPDCVDAPEELNHILPGEHYGFPDVVGVPPPDSDTRGPVATFTSHASANGLVIYQGAMFPELQGQALVAYFGSYLPGFENAGHRVVRVELAAQGDSFSGSVWPFIGGLARPLDLLALSDGSLLVTDFEAGRVFRFYR